tara:strand:- start:288 stop:2825 length:2538 start_codon:yes stop_codon:yes gene_type:complete
VIIKKKINQFNILKLIKKIFSKLIFILGLTTFLFFLFSFLYYLNSGMYQRFKPLTLIEKIDQVIFDRYLGFSIYEIDEYAKIKISSLKYIFINNKLENINIKINQENLYNLELQREKKIEGNSKKFETFSTATLNYNKKDYDIKLRVKGDRGLHWYNKNQTSYKIDLRGPDRIWGLEEFSLQKPITRNYTYELIFHKLLEFNKLISLKYFFVNLSLNDTNQGIYAVEEGFSKELIERNKKRNGPIFGVEEKLGTDYPFVQYDLYSKKYWISNHPELITETLAKLNRLKKNKDEIDEIFDLEKWATFFAIIDFSNTIHGSISKSVKLFYNPVNGKFEPIGFDGHYGLERIKDFIILDYLDPETGRCGSLCNERGWYLKFLTKNDGSLNNEFIDLYLKALNKISSEKFLEDFNEKHLKEIEFYNSQFLSDSSKKDRGYYKGIGPFIFDKNFLSNRSAFIKERLSKINNIHNLQASLVNNKITFDNVNKFFFKKLKIKCENKDDVEIYIFKNKNLIFDKSCSYLINNETIDMNMNIYVNDEIKKNLNNKLDFSKNKNLIFVNNEFILNKNLTIDKIYYFPKDKILKIKEGVKINFENDVYFISEGSIYFEGTEKKPIEIFSNKKKGSIILLNNNFKIKNVKFNNLSFPKVKNKILYGGVNVINSNVEIINSEFSNSNSEDALNIISSKTYIDNLKMTNIFADAIDIDFGEILFSKIVCKNILNDCLDVSGAKVKGQYLEATDIKDKGLSFGEESKGIISETNFNKNNVGVAVKDGSDLVLLNHYSENNTYDIAVFNKKKEYGSAKLDLKKVNDPKKQKIFLGNNNLIVSNFDLKIQKLKNSEINQLIY